MKPVLCKSQTRILVAENLLWKSTQRTIEGTWLWLCENDNDVFFSLHFSHQFGITRRIFGYHTTWWITVKSRSFGTMCHRFIRFEARSTEHEIHREYLFDNADHTSSITYWTISSDWAFASRLMIISVSNFEGKRFLGRTNNYFARPNEPTVTVKNMANIYSDQSTTIRENINNITP